MRATVSPRVPESEMLQTAVVTASMTGAVSSSGTTTRTVAEALSKLGDASQTERESASASGLVHTELTSEVVITVAGAVIAQDSVGYWGR